jgi:YVTN family beta-propeller protein
MKRSTVFLLVGTLAFAQAGWSKSEHSMLYVENVQSGDVSVIDFNALKVIDTIKLVPPVQGLEKAVHGVAVSPDGRRLFITAEADNSLRIIDTASDRVLAIIKLAGTPNEPAVSHDSRFVVVPIRDKDCAQVVNVAEETIVKTLPIKAPHNGYSDGDPRYLWVTSRGSNEVDKLDLESMDWVMKIPVGGEPRPIVVSKDRRSMYVALTKLHGFAIVDIASGSVTRRVEIPMKHEVHPLRLESAGTYTHGIGLTNDDNELWVTSEVDDAVYVYDLKADKVTFELPTGEGPNWVAFTADGKYFAVSNTDSHDVSVFDVKAHREVARIKVGNSPKRVDAHVIPTLPATRVLASK